MHQLFWRIPAVAALSATTLAHAQFPAVTTVARSGAPTPGFGGTFRNFTANNAPTISPTGRIAVSAGGVLNNTRSGLWVFDAAGSQTLTLFSMDQAPIQGGLTGDRWTPSLRPLFDTTGRVYTVENVGASVTALGLVRGLPGELTLLARENVPPPGSSNLLSMMSRPAVNPDGATVINGRAGNRFGAWYAPSGGALAPLALPGQQAPGIPGVLFGDVAMPAVAPSGSVCFGAELDLTSPGVTPDNAPTVYVGEPGALQLVARGGQVISGASFNRPIGRPDYNGNAIAMWASIGSGNSDGIIAGAPGFLSRIATRGAPGPGMTPSERWGDPHSASGFDYPVLNAGGDVAFVGQIMEGVESRGTGAWYQPWGGAMTILARTGTPLPSLGTGVAVEFVTAGLTMNAPGDVLLNCTLQGTGVTAANNRAVLAWSAEGGLQPVLRTGTSLSVGGVLRTISSFAYITGSGGADGFETSLSDGHAFAFQLAFTDGTSGVFTMTVPATPAPPARSRAPPLKEDTSNANDATGGRGGDRSAAQIHPA